MRTEGGWSFLIDENLEPQIADFLEKEDVRAEHVLDALFEGADDEEDVLPYAREHDRIIVTNDLKDFRGLPETAHEGVILVYDGERSAFEIAAALLTIVDVYPSRDELRGYDAVEDWLDPD